MKELYFVDDESFDLDLRVNPTGDAGIALESWSWFPTCTCIISQNNQCFTRAVGGCVATEGSPCYSAWC